jgi:Na+(H+)/acetate symporter ActP
MGWTGGYVLLALLLAPYLRKFGKYTIPDFVGDRYSESARWSRSRRAGHLLRLRRRQMAGVGWSSSASSTSAPAPAS